MSVEINLDGGEIQMIKAIGTGGSTVSGETLIERVTGVEEAEFLETLHSLIMMGYVIADKQSMHCYDDVKRAEFHVNSGYSRALREATDPRFRPEKKSRRVRRE
ncbi:MAG: hypothetical protein QOD99_3098 [Chthoniobacter sp.]|jgi:hypothetical protein|nr:hypothetical protein [Chthoniobacter sp.]